MNKATYLLEIMIWQKSNEGVKKSRQTAKPEMFIPEFMKSATRDKDIEVHDTQDIASILALPRK